MTKPQPKTHIQIKRIFGLGHKVRMSDDDLRELAYDVTGGEVERLSLLSFDQANAVITRLGGDPVTRKYTPRRTRNYHNQQAGIETIVTAAALQKLDDLWAVVPGRTDAGLESLCNKTIHVPRPRTAGECSKMIECVKSMNKRAAAQATTPEPSFRRVA